MSDDAADARLLLRSRPLASLATLQAATGWPYASLVATACDQEGAPVLLLSGLAEHTRNLQADGRCALLFEASAGLAEPLAAPRLTVLGRLARDDAPHLLRRYVARHPDAQAYAGFGDFGVWRVQPERAHLVAGFGRIRWLEGSALLVPAAPALAEAEPEILAHMNADHADAVQLYATLAGRTGGGWTLSGCDPEGIDLRRGGETLRLPFAIRASDAGEARAELVRLAREARNTPRI